MAIRWFLSASRALAWRSDSAASAAESKLTDAQVKQARKDLKAQGLNEKAFTDEQVRQVILRAKREGKSVKQVADEFK